MSECPECSGEGVDPYTYFRCGACQGAGKVTAIDDYPRFAEPQSEDYDD